jgi:2-polyprenyl-3-methyl-5-hydroxy-6-metoxy-1,4-benzoquinol methylase
MHRLLEMDSTKVFLNIENHLRTFEIFHFISDSYWSWAAKKLGTKRTNKLNEIREPLIDGANSEQLDIFYDYVSHPILSSVIHSMKADAIKLSGIEVDSILPQSGRILELGCSIGYLTTFYALQSSDRFVIGCDSSKKTILRAKKESQNRKIKNVEFELINIIHGLPDGTFDAILSTQVLSAISGSQLIFERIVKALSPEGILITIEALGTELEANQFIMGLKRAGLNLVNFKFLYFCDLGEKGGYPLFIFSRHGNAIEIDLKEEYKKALEIIKG